MGLNLGRQIGEKDSDVLHDANEHVRVASRQSQIVNVEKHKSFIWCWHVASQMWRYENALRQLSSH